MAGAVAADRLGLVVAPVNGALVTRAILGMWVVDVELGLVAAQTGAGVVFAVI